VVQKKTYDDNKEMNNIPAAFREGIQQRVRAMLGSPAMADFDERGKAEILSQIRAYVTAGANVIWNNAGHFWNNEEHMENDIIRVPHALEEQMDELGHFIDADNQANLMNRMEVAEEIIQEMEEDLVDLAVQFEFAAGIREREFAIVETLFEMEVAPERVRDIVLRIRAFVTEDANLDWVDQGGIIPREIEDDIMNFRDYIETFQFPVEEDRNAFINDRMEEIANEVVEIPGNAGNASTIVSNAESLHNNNETSLASNNSRGMNLVGGGRSRKSRRRRVRVRSQRVRSQRGQRGQRGQRKTRWARRTIRKKSRRGSRRFRKY
jgi:hypothetical protein